MVSCKIPILVSRVRFPDGAYLLSNFFSSLQIAIIFSVPKNYRKPVFVEKLRANLTDEGLVSFECKVVGFPTPELTWLKDGQDLRPGDVYQVPT